MTKAEDLLLAIDDITWENYVEIANELTKIDKERLNDELTKCPTMYSYYHGLMVTCKRELDKAKTDLEVCQAILKKETRNNSKGVKITEKYLESEIISNPEYWKHSECVVKADEKYGLMKALVASLTHKKDMLIQLSANKREETKLYN